MRALWLVMCLAGCGLDDDASDTGEPCTSDFDCPEDFECVAADSSNASRVCMPIQ